MARRLHFRFVLALVAAWCIMPHAALAAPSPVSGVAATYDNGVIRVQWTASNDPTVQRYRVLWSHEPIISNGGAYDDFELTAGKETTLTIQTVPPAKELFVAVTAINAKNEESTTLAGEARVEVPSAPPPSAQPILTPLPTPAPTPVTNPPVDPAAAPRLLSAQSLTLTGVLLTFSVPVTVAQENAAAAFQITGSATTLYIRSIIVQGPSVTLVTEPQLSGKRYTVIANAVRGSNGKDMDPSARTTPFTAGDAVSSGGGGGVRNLRLTVEGKTGAAYTVLASFEVPQSAQSISAIEVYVSRDGGKTFEDPSTLSPATRSVRLTQVAPGLLAMLVRTRSLDGRVSPSASAALAVGGVTTPAPLPQVPPTTRPSPQPPRSPLTSSGAGVGIVLAFTGAAMGWRRLRRKKAS